MKKILLAAMLVVSSQSVAADWEMVPSSEFCIAYSPDGSMLASGGQDGKIKVWDIIPTQVPNT